MASKNYPAKYFHNIYRYIEYGMKKFSIRTQTGINIILNLIVVSSIIIDDCDFINEI